MPGIPLEWRENCIYTGLAQWKERWLRTKVCWEFESLILYHIRTRAESVFFIFIVLLSDFILTDSPLILLQRCKEKNIMESMNIILPKEVANM